MSVSDEEHRPNGDLVVTSGFYTPARSIHPSVGAQIELNHQKTFFNMSESFEQVLEQHRNNGEFLFFFVDDWQSLGLNASEVMWGFGPGKLKTDVIREVPSLSGRYRYPLWPSQVMLRIASEPTAIWRRASLKNVAYTVREKDLIRDLLVMEFCALLQSSLVMQDAEMEAAFRTGELPGSASNPNSIQSVALTVPPTLALTLPSFSAAPVEDSAKQNPTPVPSVVGGSAVDSLGSRSDGRRFLFPYQTKGVGCEPLVKDQKVFISSDKLKDLDKRFKNHPEEYIKAVVRELLGLDSDRSRKYIGSLTTGKKGITNTATSDLLPALKAFFAPTKFSGLKDTRVSFLASQMVNRFRND